MTNQVERCQINVSHQFVHQDQFVFQVEKIFSENPNLEAAMITENEKLVGMIRPRAVNQKKNGGS